MIILLLWLFLQATAQKFSCIPLQTQSLLPAANVHCLLQDTEGYMWYGTEGGLCRDNGYQIDLFRPDTKELSHEGYKVNCIVENTNGDIIFGTPYGLYRITKDDYKINHIVLDGRSHFIEALFVDSHSHLWVGIKGDIFECTENGEIIRKYPCLIKGRPTSVASFAEDADRTIYAMLWRSGILRKRKEDNTFSALFWPIEQTPLQMVEDIQHHCFWVLTSGAGIQRMHIKGEACQLVAQTATMRNDGRGKALYMIYDNHHDLFWVTTQDNLYSYRFDGKGQLQDFPLSDWFPKGKKILDQMCMDNRGNVYVAGYIPHTFIISSPMGDVLRQPVMDISRQTEFPLLADRAVYDANHIIWIWQGRKGLMLYNSEYDKAEPMAFRCDRTIQRNSMGGIWATNSSDVFHVWKDGNKICKENITKLPKGKIVRCLYEKKGESLYIASDSIVYRMTLTGRLLSRLTTFHGVPNDIAVDHDNTIYLALGNGGICRISPMGKVEYIARQAHDAFISVCTMPDGTIWTSTAEGNVYHYIPTEGKICRESLLCSATNATIKSIRVDGLGHLWTLTDQEVCEYAPQTHAFRTFRNTDPSIDVSYFYSIETIDPNHVCITGAGALLEIQSSAELNTQEFAKAQPRLSSIMVNGEKRIVGNRTKNITLAANEEDIILNLTTLEYLHTASVSFAYKVEGMQEEWVYLPQGANSIILNNTPKGKLRLWVKATDGNGLWGKPICVITIHHEAYWWETWWAYLLYACVGLFIAYFIWRVERRIHLLRSLISRREDVRLNEIDLKREDIAEVQRNDEFIRSAVAKVEDNLSDTDYNVEALANDMCMSRVTLYRHMQEQTGMTPTVFIRDIRLKKAALLLTQYPETSVGDIAHKVGFAEPKYFSKCFKAKFGLLPKEYAANSSHE